MFTVLAGGYGVVYLFRERGSVVNPNKHTVIGATAQI
jgi:hypothetical protein